MKRYKILFSVAALCCFALPAAAQRFTTDELPKIPLDTIDTPNPKAKIVTFANNTWCYYFPDYEALTDTDIYKNHWVTSSVFAYRDVKITDLPLSNEIVLIDDLADFCPPVPSPRIISRYGPRGRRMHQGIDLSLRLADPVRAVFEGMVRYARYNGGGYGNLVIIRHPNGMESCYGHLSQLNVASGDWVAAGEVIGYGGSTGRSRGPHLHFELRYDDFTFDPERVIDFAAGELKYHTFILERGYFNVSSRMTEDLEDNDNTDAYFAAIDGQELSSDTILQNIEKAQNKPKKTVNDAVYHKVRSGDTLYAIARKYGTTVNEICRLNGITRNQTLKSGKTLRVR